MFVYLFSVVYLYILKESGSNEVMFMQLDLASLKSVRAFAKTFMETEPRLDLLINNAGLYKTQHMYTFEMPHIL